MRLNFKNLKDEQPGVIAVEQERRLLLPCGEIAMEIEAMTSEQRLWGAGQGWTIKLFEDWIRIDLDREAELVEALDRIRQIAAPHGSGDWVAVWDIARQFARSMEEVGERG